jgi:hypothetical protein
MQAVLWGCCVSLDKICNYKHFVIPAQAGIHHLSVRFAKLDIRKTVAQVKDLALAKLSLS